MVAFAHRRLSCQTSKEALQDVERSRVESDLELGGFLVFVCDINEDSFSSLSEISRSSHRIVMITGDNALTACKVSSILSCRNKGGSMKIQL